LDTNPTFGVFFMARYDEGFKRQVVQDYLAGIGGYRALGAKYGIDQAMVRLWVDKYRQHGDAGLRRKSSHYSAQFKLSVLQQMWQEELSYRQVVTMFDLRGGTGVISGWERLYHQGGLDALQPKPRGRPKKMKPPKPTEAVAQQATDTRTAHELRQENEYLRAEVAYLKKLDALVRAKKLAAQPKRKPSSN
jgi:transposase